MAISGRKKLLLFPPMQTYPGSLVQIVNNGITAASFATDAISAAAFSQAAADKIWATPGRSLVAGSYSVRASSTQTGVVNMASSASDNATIASVTLARAVVASLGCTTSSGNLNEGISKVQLAAPTTLTITKTTASGTSQLQWQVAEFF